MPSRSRWASYGVSLLRHARILLPLGVATGAIVGRLWGDLVYGLVVGAAFGAAWTLLLSLHTRSPRGQGTRDET